MNLNKNCTVIQIKNHRKLLEHGNLDISLTEILSSESCQNIIQTSREHRNRIYNPLETLLMFIKQVINPDKSCRNIVSGAIAERMFAGKKVQSSNTGPYCKARLRLPGTMLKSLVSEVGVSAVKKEPKSWKWRNRAVKIVDGTTLLMPDTVENQSVFPKSSAHEDGVGFPIARLVTIMSLSIGVVLDYAVEACKGKGTGEHSLFRSILRSIHTGDVLLADRYFPCFFLMAELKKIGADGVFHGQGQRHYDFREGKQIGKKDHITIWKKPRIKPDWMDYEAYENYPKEIEIREFKVNGRIFVTTFLDGKKFHKSELAELYEMRWKIEINLKSIKTILKMEMLSCKKPDMILKEIGAHLLAYNIIRLLMAQACIRSSVVPNQISFKGTVQLLNHFMPYFKKNNKEKMKTFNTFLNLIISNRVGNRPGRIEPIVIKRRPKRRELLHFPRSILKEKLIRKREKTLLKYAKAA